MKAVISRNPQARVYGMPDEVDAIDITNCLIVLNHLRYLAKFVNDDPSSFSVVSQEFAYLIREIERALNIYE